MQVDCNAPKLYLYMNLKSKLNLAMIVFGEVGQKKVTMSLFCIILHQLVPRMPTQGSDCISISRK
jgi:hypothetical protein